jgi:hypothetical protein
MHGTSTLTAFIGFNFGQRVVLHRRFAPLDVLRTIERRRSPVSRWSATRCCGR